MLWALNWLDVMCLQFCNKRPRNRSPDLRNGQMALQPDETRPGLVLERVILFFVRVEKTKRRCWVVFFFFFSSFDP